MDSIMRWAAENPVLTTVVTMSAARLAYEAIKRLRRIAWGKQGTDNVWKLEIEFAVEQPMSKTAANNRKLSPGKNEREKLLDGPQA